MKKDLDSALDCQSVLAGICCSWLFAVHAAPHPLPITVLLTPTSAASLQGQFSVEIPIISLPPPPFKTIFFSICS